MPPLAVPLAARYDLLLVALSVLVAVGASYAALDLAGRVSAAKGRARASWLAAGAVTMGIGIWSMHFTGMLALKLPIAQPIIFDGLKTACSAVVAIVASGLALSLASRRTLGPLPLLAGGTCMGIAIVAMHYTGMAAMQVPCVLSYDWRLVAASVGIAIGASMAALWLAFRLSAGDWTLQKLGAAVVMGSAIAGMHYTGMAAGSYTPFCLPPGGAWPTFQVNDLGAVAIGAGTLLVITVALLGSHEERLRRRQELLKDQFLSILSHELRTPINAIMGFASVMDDEELGPVPEPYRPMIKRMLNSADRLLGLVNDLLDMSKIQAGEFALTLAPTHLADVVRDVLAILQDGAAQKQVALINQLPRDLPLLRSDGQRVGQVLLNLVHNAIKFTEPGGSITIRAAKVPGFLRCEVEDTGIGIPQRDIARLFVPFSQVDSSSTRRAGGVGLGLSIARALILAHGGDIGVVSEPGKGSRFWFTLPLAAEAPSESPTAPS